MVHTSVALDKLNASASNAVFHTQRTIARDAAKTKQLELWQAVKCIVRIKSWKARERVSWEYVLVQNVNACRNGQFG